MIRVSLPPVPLWVARAGCCNAGLVPTLRSLPSPGVLAPLFLLAWGKPACSVSVTTYWRALTDNVRLVGFQRTLMPQFSGSNSGLYIDCPSPRTFQGQDLRRC